MWVETVKWVVYVIMGALACFALFFIGKELFRGVLKLSPKRKDELLRIFLVLMTLLIVASLLSFNSKDYSSLNLLSFKLQQDITNKGGVVGAIIGLWIYRSLGVSGYIIPIIFLLWGVLPKKYYPSLWMKTAFLLGVSILICFLIANYATESISQGGIVGEKLVASGTKYFGIGRWFIAGAFVVALLLTFEKIRKFVFRKPRLPKLKVKPKSEPKTQEPIKPKEAIKETVEEPKIESPAPVVEEAPKLDAEEFKKLYLSKLKDPEVKKEGESETVLQERAKVLERKFEEFDVFGKITNIAPGPVITRYEYELASGIKVSRVASLSDDIAMSMKSPYIRIVAPIPGKSAIGIEIPNEKREYVYLKELLASSSFESIKSELGIVLGKDIAGDPVCDDVAGFPHLLVAGTTGSGKSVCINVMIASILYRADPSEVRFLMIDPKRLELRVYNGIPHLIRPVISDAKESLSALKDAIGWMESRYKEFAKVGVRDIAGYNQRADKPKPYILILIDELADLMMTAPRDIEAILTRLAQMSRAVGIHLVLATQRPSVDIVTGLIKANFPARAAFQVASKTDSRTILDMNGAEKLLGKGDMLFLPPGTGVPDRLHGAYISTQESRAIADLWVERWLRELLSDKIEEPDIIAKEVVKEELIESIVEQNTPGARERIDLFSKKVQSLCGVPSEKIKDLLLGLEYYPKLEEETRAFEVTRIREEKALEEDVDELFEEARELVTRHQTASVSLFQRQFKIGYARAGRLIDELERAGVVGPYVGSKSREVLILREEV
ncbi:DNA translocase FtsK 4TM domain-containing protein [candidate division WOR-3 bacterium]|nr:DNA translocase FtsK 4TM domain-containing protein [candidate division WOR-3 bacterium]